MKKKTKLFLLNWKIYITHWWELLNDTTNDFLLMKISIKQPKKKDVRLKGQIGCIDKPKKKEEEKTNCL